MRVLKKTLFTKRILVFISFIIVSLILWNTYIFFQKFKQEERAKMEIYATTLKELATNTDLNASAKLPLKIIESTANIPLMLVNEKGEISSWQNLDSIKAKDPNYLKKQLAIMKKENSPIAMDYFGVKQFVFYRNSLLLNKLSYYPLALILILILFLTVIYLQFSSSRIAEQNKLWTGMAKETAHQIGTPLSSLLGWIEMLKTENVQSSYILEMEKDVSRLNTIANRFSKIGSLPELKEEDLVTITKTAYAYLESRSSKHVAFHFSTNSDEMNVKINKELFGWVIENLVKNAVDAMQGKGSIMLNMFASGKKVSITITDTGKGISKKQFKHVFRPGYTTKKRGWGLGLSLSKRIIEEYHKGKIFVKKSEINQGTSIQIEMSLN